MIGNLFKMYGEPYIDTEWWISDNWSFECAEYNQAMDEWEQTKHQVAAASEPEAEELEQLAMYAEQAAQELASAQCERLPGKNVCIDFFIMNCAIANFAGDCRQFDRNAHYSNSRVQLYIDPETRTAEVKYNCTKIVLLGFPIKTVCDSAKVFNPATDLVVEPYGTDGSFKGDFSFKNNACHYVEAACENGVWDLAIDGTVWMIKDASASTGWRMEFDRDGFPSMGAYLWRNDYYNVIREDPQKTMVGVNAIRALAGWLRSRSANVPEPENPNNCARS